MPVLAHNDPFYSSKFSIDWAQDHVTEVERELEAFRQSDSHATVTEPDADGVYNLLKFKVTKSVPRALIGHVIDTIYNLRAALDQAIYSVATLNNTLSLSGTPSFPIRGAPTAFETAFDGATGKSLPQEISDLVRTFKPYKGGNDLIWALNQLCNANKHGFIRPLPMAATGMAVDGISAGIQIFISPKWDRSKNEMILAQAPVNAKFTMNYNLAVDIVFSDIEFVEGKPVISMLYDFLDVVEGVVMAIEAETIRIGLS